MGCRQSQVQRALNMEGLRAAFDDLNISGGPFSVSKSTLLAELLALPQPLELRYPKTTRAQFLLDLKDPSFKHGAQDQDTARSIFIEKKKTDNNRVVVFGKTQTERLWVVKITRGPSKKKKKQTYVATVSIGAKTYKDRIVFCGP